jgi:ankyrin repeat protein
VTRFLLENGADVNARDAVGWTALDHAKDKQHKEIIELLEQHGARQKQQSSLFSGD